jgi:hypothetical protein
MFNPRSLIDNAFNYLKDKRYEITEEENVEQKSKERKRWNRSKCCNAVIEYCSYFEDDVIVRIVTKKEHGWEGLAPFLERASTPYSCSVCSRPISKSERAGEKDKSIIEFKQNEIEEVINL